MYSTSALRSSFPPIASTPRSYKRQPSCLSRLVKRYHNPSSALVTACAREAEDTVTSECFMGWRKLMHSIVDFVLTTRSCQWFGSGATGAGPAD